MASATNKNSTDKKLLELRVVNLRSELEKRGLDKNGIKTVLLERLEKALQNEGEIPDEYLFEEMELKSKTKIPQETFEKYSKEEFTSRISLMMVGKSATVNRIGGPKRSVPSVVTNSKRGRPSPMPITDVRLDAYHHWPEYRPNKNRCRNCTYGYSRVYCDKCNICLCLNQDRNCFKDFHV